MSQSIRPGKQIINQITWGVPIDPPLDFLQGGYMLMTKGKKENTMIDITITQTAKIELFKVLERFNAKSVRLIQQGFG